MKPTRSLRILAVATAALICSVSTGTASADETGPPSPILGPGASVRYTFVAADGVVHYTFDPDSLPGYRLTSESGVKSENGCSFEVTGAGDRGIEPTYTEATEVVFDPATCTSTFARATYPVSSVPEVVRSRLAADELEAIAADTGEVAPFAATANYSGFLSAYLQDPILIAVTSTRSNVKWTASSSCVTSSTRTPIWGWFTQSGWSRTSYQTISNSSSCSKAILNIAAKYKNDAFCPGSGNTTYANHSETRYEGKPGGQVTWAYKLNKSGGCSSLLKYKYTLVKP